MFSPTIEKLIKDFSKFPTVGPRTAARFVFYLIRTPKEKIEELIKSMEELKEKIKLCPLCFKSFEPAQISEKLEAGKGEGELCPICQDPRRDKGIVCIIEKEIDLEAIEKTGKFKGFYFILGGTISGFEKKEQKKRIEERLEKLQNRIKKTKEIKEIILALNSITEAQNTTLWLKRKLEPLEIRTSPSARTLRSSVLKITQLGQGLPKGGELEYADEETLSSAFENRK